MGIRNYKYNNGPSSAGPTTVTDASTDYQIPSYGQVKDRMAWGEDVDDYAALRALDEDHRADNQTRFVSGTEEDWYFNPASAAADDGVMILKPDDLGGGDPGRWLLKSSAGGGGSGGGTSGIETLQQKLEAEKQLIFTEDLDNTLGESGVFAAVQQDFKATLLKSQSVSDTVLEMVWNAEAVNQSDLNMDSTTGWTATGQGGSLTASSTAGDFQVGTAGLKFDKAGSGTEAAIRYDTGSQIRQFNGKSRVWMYVKLPSITNLTNIVLRIYADSTSNFQTFTKTTQFDSSALAIGWNLVMFDISTGGSAGGTGWDITKLCRYIECGVTATSGQTYTGIIFDSVYFSYYRPQEIGVIGSEYSLFNNSTKEDVVIDGSNTLHDGRLTLASALANTYSGGATGTARARVQRSTILISGDSNLAFDNDATFSGAVTLAQELRLATLARDTISGDAELFIDSIAIQAYAITAVGGSTIDVEDPVDQHLNLLSGDTLDFFDPTWKGAKKKYDFVKSAAMTANSSASGGTTTLTVNTTSLSVGMLAVKRNVTQVAQSVVAKGASENFQAATILSNPDGIQLIETGMDYPNRNSLYGHWQLAGVSAVEATRNRAAGTAGVTLSVTGSPGLNGSFQRGRFSLVGVGNGSNYLSLSQSNSLPLSGNTTLAQHSLWFYWDGSLAANRMVINRINNGNSSGWSLTNQSSQTTIVLRVNNTENTPQTLTIGWNHIFVVLNDAGVNYIYLNGIKSTTISATPGDSATEQVWMVNNGFSYFGAGFKEADHLGWSGGSVLTLKQILSIQNAGYFRPIGQSPLHRLRYESTGVSGQKFSQRVRFARSTTAVTPLGWKSGLIVA